METRKRSRNERSSFSISDSMPPPVRQLDMATLKWAGLDGFLGQARIPSLDRAQVAAFLSTYSSSSGTALVDGKRVRLHVSDLCAATHLPSDIAVIDRAQIPAPALLKPVIRAFLERLECGPFEPSQMESILHKLRSTGVIHHAFWGHYAEALLKDSISKAQAGSLRTFRCGRWLTAVIRRALATDLEWHPLPPASSTSVPAALPSSSSSEVTSLMPALPSLVLAASAASPKQNVTEEGMRDVEPTAEAMEILPFSGSLPLCITSRALEPAEISQAQTETGPTPTATEDPAVDPECRSVPVPDSMWQAQQEAMEILPFSGSLPLCVTSRALEPAEISQAQTETGPTPAATEDPAVDPECRSVPVPDSMCQAQQEDALLLAIALAAVNGTSVEPEPPSSSPVRLGSVEGANRALPSVREAIQEETVPDLTDTQKLFSTWMQDAAELEDKKKALAAAFEKMFLVDGAILSKWREEVEALKSECHRTDREVQAVQLELNALKEQLKSAEAKGQEHEEELSSESVFEEFQDLQLEGEDVKLALDRLKSMLLTSCRSLTDASLNFRGKAQEMLQSITETRNTYEHAFQTRQMWEQEVKANLDACNRGEVFEFCNQSVKRVMNARQCYKEQIAKKQEKEKEVAALKEEEMSLKSVLAGMITDFFERSSYEEQRDWILSNAASIVAIPADGKWAPAEFCKLLDAYEYSKQVQNLLVEMVVRGNVELEQGNEHEVGEGGDVPET